MNEEKREVSERENSRRIIRHGKNALHSFYRWAVDRHGTGDYPPSFFVGKWQGNLLTLLGLVVDRLLS